jgi:hypothetical protein
MKSKLSKGLLGVLLLVFAGLMLYSEAAPVGPRIEYQDTEQPGVITSGRVLNDSKGRITTVAFNVSQPNEDWKGYVGNVTGKLMLDDANNNTLFDWTFSTIGGEVYATRGGTVSWAALVCANHTHVVAESSALNHVASQSDKLNDTFSFDTHPEFYAGDTRFQTDDCNFTLYTYVDGAAGQKSFPELLLYDTTNSNLIYAAIINDTQRGFDGNNYDFQMLVSEDSSRTANIGYYFYVEVG